VAGENFGKFGKLNVICQYFTQPNLPPFFIKLNFRIKNLHMHEYRIGGANLGVKLSILKYLRSLAEAEAKFDPAG